MLFAKDLLIFIRLGKAIKPKYDINVVVCAMSLGGRRERGRLYDLISFHIDASYLHYSILVPSNHFTVITHVITSRISQNSRGYQQFQLHNITLINS